MVLYLLLITLLLLFVYPRASSRPQGRLDFIIAYYVTMVTLLK